MLTSSIWCRLGALVTITVVHSGAFVRTAIAQDADPTLARLGGEATVSDSGVNAFSLPAPLLSAAERRVFAVGNSFFKQNWVVAPASASSRDGLGPLFNARSCSGCHFRDGRSRPPEDGEPDRGGLLLRIGVRELGVSDRPHHLYGGQLQDGAVPGVSPEARVEIRWKPVSGEYGDGSPFELIAPEISVVEAAYGALDGDVVLGPRVAPQLIGLGLLEAISVESILHHADPFDRDGDGISGRPHFDGAGDTARLGRFGWKATQPSVAEQTAAAFVNDMGITSPLQPSETLTDAQRGSIEFVSGGSPEIDATTLDRVVFYTRSLGVPAQRSPDDPEVVSGRGHFTAFGCAACHQPSFTTVSRTVDPLFGEQTIHPYTDLLLHDLGPGLADGKHDGDAGPTEWRTQPLWGIGLVPIVNGHSRYLHDGRARSLAEAVLWHGGEALASAERFRLATSRERAQLLAFLGSL